MHRPEARFFPIQFHDILPAAARQLRAHSAFGQKIYPKFNRPVTAIMIMHGRSISRNKLREIQAARTAVSVRFGHKSMISWAYYNQAGSPSIDPPNRFHCFFALSSGNFRRRPPGFFPIGTIDNTYGTNSGRWKIPQPEACNAPGSRLLFYIPFTGNKKA